MAEFNGPVLIVCALKDAMWTWENELDKWLPGVNRLTYHGTQKQRGDLKGRISKSDYVITTPRMLPEVLSERTRWMGFGVDEAQYVKGRGTDAVRLFRKIKSDRFNWISGSPIVNTPADLWVALNICNKKQFSSYWRWVNDTCELENNGFGNKITGVKNAAETRKVLEDYYYAVLKDEVQDQLPPKNRYGIHCEMTSVQKKLYTELESDMIGYLQGGELLLAPNVLSVGTRIRQLLITPELLPDWEGEAESGALELLHNRVKEDFDNDQAVVIFTPFSKALPIIERHLPECKTFLFHGGLSNRKTIEDFQEYKGHKALLGTIRSAASFNAYSATVAYFMGYDWTPAYNFQAEDRIHRLGQTKSVDIRYIVNNHTVDDHLMDVLDQKHRWQDAILGRRK